MIIPRSPRALAVWCGACCLLLVFQYAILGKERILRGGHTLLLELAPADPRSLMQGDYMVLNYTLNGPVQSLHGISEGTAVIRPDAQGVGCFVRVDNGTPLAEGEYLLRFAPGTSRWGRPVIKPDSFFFQEGQAALFQQAGYGLFLCEHKGPCLLVGLADTDRQLITPAPGAPVLDAPVPGR